MLVIMKMMKMLTALIDVSDDEYGDDIEWFLVMLKMMKVLTTLIDVSDTENYENADNID